MDTSTVKLSSTDPLNDMHNYYSFIPQLTFMKRTMKMSRILALDYVNILLRNQFEPYLDESGEAKKKNVIVG